MHFQPEDLCCGKKKSKGEEVVMVVMVMVLSRVVREGLRI